MALPGRTLEPPRTLEPQGRVMEALVENRTRVAAVERSTPVPRILLPYATGYTDWGSGFEVCTYYIDRGRVYVDGVAKANTGAAALVSTLPTGFRPRARVPFVVPCSFVAAGVVRVDILADGTIVSQAAPVVGQYISLQGIHFRV